jgi:hypothetical protein
VVVRWPHGALLVTGTSQMMQELDEVHVLPFDDLSVNCICELVTCVVSLIHGG